MTCPRCQHAVLEERERDGIVIDLCRSCRGVWLDRGELEKLIARAARDLDELTPHRDDTPTHGARYRDGADYRRGPRRNRRWFEALADIFD